MPSRTGIARVKIRAPKFIGHSQALKGEEGKGFEDPTSLKFGLEKSASFAEASCTAGISHAMLAYTTDMKEGI